MTWGQGKGGWLWPGRGLFRVQSRGVHSSYASDYASAPANRKDIFEGTVNAHWKAGVALRAKPGDAGFAARTGDTTIYLASSGSLTNLTVGDRNAAQLGSLNGLPTACSIYCSNRRPSFRVIATRTCSS